MSMEIRKASVIQSTINLDRRWIELVDYERDGYEFQGGN